MQTRDYRKYNVQLRVLIVVILLILIKIISSVDSKEKVIVSGNSMNPTFKDGDIVEVNYKNNKEIERNDVIVFTLEDQPDLVLIKRAIGIPGDNVRIENNDLYINDEFYNNSNNREDYIYEANYNLDRGEIFVVGDNYSNSIDSRNYGLVSIKNIIGIVKE